MYKVLFAEDEVLVRLGLKNAVDWERFDMEVVADVDNGIAAWELFKSCKLDLVITDIKMSGMDGCELIRKIRSEDKECGIIIISCLDDFKILQKMIPYNILGYLLKASMTMDEIHNQLAVAKAYLDGIKKNQEVIIVPMEKPEAVLFTYLVEKTITLAQVKECMEKRKKTLPDIIKTIILFEIDGRDRERISQLGITFIKDMIQGEFKGGFLFLIDDSRFGFLLPEELKEDEEKVTTVVILVHSVLQITLQYYIHVTQSGGVDHLPNEYDICVEGSRNLQEGIPIPKTDYNINKGVEYIQNNYSKQITLNDVAEVVNLSPNYFSALFKKEMHISFISYLTMMRVTRAKELLSHSREYLYVIAEEAGFQNFEHFSRIFKQKTGKSPANWRKEYEENNGG